jgi:hypothetical protein
MHIPEVCPGIPEDYVIHDMDFDEITKHCNQSLWDIDMRRLMHAGLDRRPGFEAGKGRFMIFVRQPEQRLISMFNNRLDEDRNHDIDWMMEARSGELTKILTRDLKTAGDSISPPTDAEVTEAKRRLETGFAFVGNTDEWNLSLCLFNKMFNQTCRPTQFYNSHPSQGKTTSVYDTKMLKGWRDRYDNEVYDLAIAIYKANLKKYKVSESSCAACYREAGAL